LSSASDDLIQSTYCIFLREKEEKEGGEKKKKGKGPPLPCREGLKINALVPPYFSKTSFPDNASKGKKRGGGEKEKKKPLGRKISNLC